MLLANLLTNGLGPAAYLLVVGLGPLIFFTWIIHQLERLMQRRLSMSFGWNSVLITGWLGTPIHELSHAIMCVIFRHDIVEMELFKPDRKNGRLGYVTHSYQRGNLYQELGTFFIGMAPLLGGSLVLFLLLLIFFPDVARTAFVTIEAENGSLPLWQQVGNSLQQLFAGLFQIENLLSIRLWLFVYLVTCVGSHMAPSMSDYEGGFKGGALLLIGLGIASVLVVVISPQTATVASLVRPVLVPTLTGLIAVIALCVTSTLVVFAITELIGKRLRG